uniref:Uncharacterized protein n=1 Tax=Vespula pensylvanica TaxID=30213 RepID=A0A834P7G9_VESPE|nr:hypothetical protein H0235_004423 [Vespula pensylvanica]
MLHRGRSEILLGDQRSRAFLRSLIGIGSKVLLLAINNVKLYSMLMKKSFWEKIREETKKGDSSVKARGWEDEEEGRGGERGEEEEGEEEEEEEEEEGAQEFVQSQAGCR